MADQNAITESSTCCQPQTADAARRRTPEWSYRPPTDIVDLGDSYVLTADVPGASEESIELSVEDGILSIQAGVAPRFEAGHHFELQEYGVGNYHRRFRLGDDVDPEQISAEYSDGVLTVTLAKRTSARRRRIAINAG